MIITATSNLPSVLYHGTSSEFLDDIMNKGLVKPYLAVNYDKAIYYAEGAVEFNGGHPVVLAVPTASLDRSLLRYDNHEMDEPSSPSDEASRDEASRDEAWNLAEKEHPDWINEKDNSIIHVPPEAWEISLAGVGTVMYYGTVELTDQNVKTAYRIWDNNPPMDAGQKRRKAIADPIEAEADALRRFKVDARRDESKWTGRDYMVETVIDWCGRFVAGPGMVHPIAKILPNGTLEKIPPRRQTNKEWQESLRNFRSYCTIVTPEDARKILDKIRYYDANPILPLKAPGHSGNSSDFDVMVKTSSSLGITIMSSQPESSFDINIKASASRRTLLEERARSLFPSTSSVDASNYLLSDGTGISLMGDDHRIISEVFKGKVPRGYYNSKGSGSGYMLAFMGEAGAVRTRLLSDNSLAISFIELPNYLQINSILRTKADRVYCDRYDKQYNHVDQANFIMPSEKQELRLFLQGDESSGVVKEFSSFDIVVKTALDENSDRIEQAAKAAGYNLGPVYHGTYAKFNQFSMNYFGQTDDGYYGQGFYFSSDEATAKDYGPNIIKAYLKVSNPLRLPDAGSGDHVSLLDARDILAELYDKPELRTNRELPKGYYVKQVERTYYNKDWILYAVHPLPELYGTEQEIYGDEAATPDQAIVSFNDRINDVSVNAGWLPSLMKRFDRNKLTDVAKAKGYDAIFIEDAEFIVGHIDEVIVFDPSQIKFVGPTYDDDNREIPVERRFNPESPDMRFDIETPVIRTAAVSDDIYLAAVEAGDIETCQKMVNEAAKAAGYTIGPVWHGTNQREITRCEEAAIGSGSEGGKRKSGAWGRGFYFSESVQTAKAYGDNILKIMLSVKNPLVLDFTKNYSDWQSDAKEFRSMTGIGQNTENATDWAKNKGYDGVILYDSSNGEGQIADEIIAFYPSQMKSADPVVRDDASNVIPLSKRFNSSSSDIRFETTAPVIRTQSSSKPKIDSLDIEYQKALDKKDKALAHSLVEKAAKAAGYTIGPVYHGTVFDDITVFNGGWWAEDKQVTREFGAITYRAYLKGKFAEADDLKVMYQALYGSLNYDEKSDENREAPLSDGEIGNAAMRGLRFTEEVRKQGYDGVHVIDDTNKIHGWTYAVFSSSNVKSANIVSLDPMGKIIPLSRRFDESSDFFAFQDSAPVIRQASFDVVIKTASSDEEYLTAAENGDIETCQKMVNEAAKAAGYTIGPVWHGSHSPDIHVFDIAKSGSIQTSDWGAGVYLTPSKWLADGYRIHAVKETDEEDKRLWSEFESKAREMGTTPMNMSIDLGYNSEKYKELDQYADKWKKHRNMMDKTTQGKVYGLFVNLRNPMIYTAEDITDPYLAKQAIDKGHDGLIIVSKGDFMEEILVFHPNQIKLSDPVVYDDNGNIIPLSQRFNSSLEDVRFTSTQPVVKTQSSATNAGLSDFDIDVPVIRTAVVSPEQAKILPHKVDLPKDETFESAVKGTKGATITDDGLEIELTRNQHPDQGGEPSIRSGVFYQPYSSPSKLPYRGTGGYGGTETIRGLTLLRRPFFIKGATGGLAPERAYEIIKGKGSCERLYKVIVKFITDRFYNQGSTKQLENILRDFGGDPSMADEILRVTKLQGGNGLRMSIQENVIAHAVRDAGYDSVVGWSKRRDGTAFISEVFDVREVSYPSKWSGGNLHPSLLKENLELVSFFNSHVKKAESLNQEPDESFDIVVENSENETENNKENQQSKDSSKTETREFLRWFWNSKVVDKDGKPKAVYHGTTGNFNEFKPGGNSSDVRIWNTKGRLRSMIGKSGRGFFFSPTSENLPAAHNYNESKDNANIMPVYLSIANPLVFDADTKDWAIETIAEGNREFPRLITDEAYYNLLNAGYDGIFIYDNNRTSSDGEPNEYVALDPRQIKSATGNRGTFEWKNPDITASFDVVIKTASANDEEYLKAVEEGNLDKAQQMIDEAAKVAGYTTGPVWHGASPSSSFSEFIPSETGAIWFTDSREYASFTAEDKFEEGEARLVQAFLRMSKPLDLRDKTGNQWDQIRDNSSFIANAKADGYDGVVLNDENGGIQGVSWVVFDPSQVKSAEPVTYENGKVVALSERFDSSRGDIRFEQTAPVLRTASNEESLYPKINGTSDGRIVLDRIPNTDSISASLENYEELPGIRDVPLSDFHLTGQSYSVSETERIKKLSKQIQETNTISPLIVVIDDEGPYILEGSHRAEALFLLGAKSFPALVVMDRDVVPENDITVKTATQDLFSDWETKGNRLKGWRGKGSSVGIGSEGNGLYVAKTQEVANIFGHPIPVFFDKPSSTLLVDDEPLYLLHESEEIMKDVQESDTEWLKLNKAAVKAAGVTDEDWRPEDVAQKLTDVIVSAGYDSVYVNSGGDEWVVLLKPKNVKIGMTTKLSESELVNPSSEDAEYLDAIDKNDMVKAQQMVDAAAKTAGYTIGPVWHGSGVEFTEFDINKSSGRGFYFAKKKDFAESYAKGERPSLIGAYVSIQNPIEEKDFNEMAIKDGLSKTEAVDQIRKLDYDGIVGQRVVVVFSPKQIKSAEPVTYDNGKIIPLSKRFDINARDIRFDKSNPVIRTANVNYFNDMRLSLGKRGVKLDRQPQTLAHTSNKLLKNSRVHGEYWITEHGDVLFADGDVSEMGHEQQALQTLTNELLEMLDINDNGQSILLSDYSSQIAKAIGKKKQKLPAAIKLYLKENHTNWSPKVDEMIDLTWDGSGDVRNFMMKNRNWKRILNNNIETHTLATEDISAIANGLNNILSQESDSDSIDEEFNIYIISNQKWLRDVPFSEIKSRHISFSHDYTWMEVPKYHLSSFDVVMKTGLAKPSANVLAKPLYHATANESDGKAILECGEIRPPESTGRRWLDPVHGRTYSSPSPENAAIYALGGVFMGHAIDWQSETGRFAGRYGYIFEVNPASLNDVQPDEDSVGEILSKGLDIEYDKLSHQWTLSHNGKAPWWLTQMAIQYVAKSRLLKLQGGEYAYYASVGKQLLTRMSDDQKIELLNRGDAHVAHNGPVRISRAWRLDKSRSKELASDGSNLFELAEEIPLTIDHVADVTKMVVKTASSDDEYLDAVNKGDMQAAQKMVDEKAMESGYNIKASHATKAQFNEFNTHGLGAHFGTPQASSNRIKDLTDFSVIIKRDPGVFKTLNVFLSLHNPLRLPDMADLDDATGQPTLFDKDDIQNLEDMGREPPRCRAWEADEDVQMTLLERGIIDIDEFEEVRGYDKTELVQLLKDKGYDGIVYENKVESVGEDSYIIFDPNQVKIADPVVLDESGKVIPLSQRFNKGSNDIRFNHSAPVIQTADSQVKQEDLEDGNNILDNEYMQAVKEKDLEKCSRLVDKAAKEAGYTIGPVWHGTSSEFKAFDKGEIGKVTAPMMKDPPQGFYFTDSKDGADKYSGFASMTCARPSGERRIIGAYLKLDNPANIVRLSPSEDSSLSSQEYKLLTSNGNDGAIVYGSGDAGSGFDTPNVYVVFEPKQIKLADPIVYDDGKVIPLSKRFNIGNDDMRFETTTSVIRKAELDFDIKVANSVEEDYRGEHQAPDSTSGAPMHDLSGVFPDDFYSADGLRMYNGGFSTDAQAWGIIRDARNRPNKTVKVFRAVPYLPTIDEQIVDLENQKRYILKNGTIPSKAKGSWKNSSAYFDWLVDEIERIKKLPAVDNIKREIKPGDWVAITRAYAKDHGESNLNNSYRIISKSVLARHLFTTGDDLQEWGYDPAGGEKKFSHNDMNTFGITLTSKKYRLPSGDNETFLSGEVVWFEYHCNESHDSSDAVLWYHSHQPVTVIGLSDEQEEMVAKTMKERGDAGMPLVYNIRFSDGSTGDAFEDELMYSKSEFYRPDPPKSKHSKKTASTKVEYLGQNPNSYEGKAPRFDWNAMDNAGRRTQKSVAESLGVPVDDFVYRSMVNLDDLQAIRVEKEDAADLRNGKAEPDSMYIERATEMLAEWGSLEHRFSNDQFEPWRDALPWSYGEGYDDDDVMTLAREMEARDTEASYPEEDFSISFNEAFPPIEVIRSIDGELHVNDGNHRVDIWKQQGFDVAPAWVNDEQLRAFHSKIRKGETDTLVKTSSVSLTGYRNATSSPQGTYGTFYSFEKQPRPTITKTISFDNLLDMPHDKIIPFEGLPSEYLAIEWFSSFNFRKAARERNMDEGEIMDEMVAIEAVKRGYDGIRYGDFEFVDLHDFSSSRETAKTAMTVDANVSHFLHNDSTAWEWAKDNIADIEIDESEDENPISIEKNIQIEQNMEKAALYSDKYNSITKLPKVTIYRALLINDLTDIQWDNIGTHWSFEKEGAGTYGASSVQGNKTIILTGETHPDNIDWEYGFTSFMWYGDSQWECALKSGSRVEIVAIDEKPVHPIVAYAQAKPRKTPHLPK